MLLKGKPVKCVACMHVDNWSRTHGTLLRSKPGKIVKKTYGCSVSIPGSRLVNKS